MLSRSSFVTLGRDAFGRRLAEHVARRRIGSSRPRPTPPFCHAIPSYSQSVVVLHRDVVIEAACTATSSSSAAMRFCIQERSSTDASSRLAERSTSRDFAITRDGVESHRDFTFDARSNGTSTSYVLDYRIVREHPSPPFLLPGLYGIRIPAYDRSDGLSLPFGPTITSRHRLRRDRSDRHLPVEHRRIRSVCRWRVRIRSPRACTPFVGRTTLSERRLDLVGPRELRGGARPRSRHAQLLSRRPCRSHAASRSSRASTIEFAPFCRACAPSAIAPSAPTHLPAEARGASLVGTTVDRMLSSESTVVPRATYSSVLLGASVRLGVASACARHST